MQLCVKHRTEIKDSPFKKISSGRPGWLISYLYTIRQRSRV